MLKCIVMMYVFLLFLSFNVFVKFKILFEYVVRSTTFFVVNRRRANNLYLVFLIVDCVMCVFLLKLCYDVMCMMFLIVIVLVIFGGVCV